MKNKMRKLAFAVCAAMLSLASQSAQMASQAWTQNVVSNSASETKAWVRQNFTGDGSIVDTETEMWTEDGGKTLMLKDDGVIKTAQVLSVVSKRRTKGFYVVNDDYAKGVVTQFQFYAWVGGNRYYCPNNKRIPYIVENGLVTQTWQNVTHVYENLLVEEYVTKTNGEVSVSTWESQQTMSNSWTLISISLDGKMRSFDIARGNGDALEMTPLAFQRGLLNSSLASYLCGMIVQTAYAEKFDVELDGYAGTISITVQVSGCDPQTTDVGISYGGPSKWREGKQLDPIIDGSKVTYRWTEWWPNPGVEKSDWTALNNWLPASVTYTWETVDHVQKSKTINRTQLSKLIGGSLQEKLNASWQEPKENEYSKQVSYNCKDTKLWGHYYPKYTCICKFCQNDRHHNLVSPGNNMCLKCNKKTGFEKKPETDTCEGRGSLESEHTGWQHYPKDGYFAPTEGKSPRSLGFENYCVCQCYASGDENGIAQSHDYSNDEDLWYVVKGDVMGGNEDSEHTRLLVCKRCSEGWKAKVEPHVKDENREGEVFPFNKIIDGKYQECAPDAEDVNKEFHATVGYCKPKNIGCEAPIYGSVLHIDDNKDCVCDECSAVLHVFYETPECPEVRVCKNCNKHFHVINGKPDYTTGTSSSSKYKKWHTYDESGQIPDNYDTHHCKCIFQVLHEHNWEEKEGSTTGEMICVDCDEPDDNTGGCGMVKDHDKDSHDEVEHFKVHGHCGSWYCDTCGKKVTHTKSGVEFPTVHATYNEWKTNRNCVVSKTLGSDFYCAACNHSANGTFCGTYIDVDGNKNRLYTTLSDWQLHGPLPPHQWKPDKTTSETEKTQHKCKCEAHTRAHNTVIDKAVVIANNDKTHSEKRSCTKIDPNTGEEFLDNCHHNWQQEKPHNPYPTGTFKMNTLTNTICMCEVQCHTFNDDTPPQDIGCGLKYWLNVAHEMTNIPPCTVVAEDNGLHKFKRGCMNCGEYEMWKTNTHNYTVHSNITETTHKFDYVCDATPIPIDRMNCGYETNVVPLEAHDQLIDTGYIYKNDECHTKTGMCSICKIFKIDIDTELDESHTGTNINYVFKNDLTHVITNFCTLCTNYFGSGDAFHIRNFEVEPRYEPVDDEYHKRILRCVPKEKKGCNSDYVDGGTNSPHTFLPFQIMPMVFVDNQSHTWSNYCDKCKMNFLSNKTSPHDGMGKEICDVYHYTGSADHISLHEHEGSNYCASCQHYYLAKQHLPCVYDWGAGSQWTLNPHTNGYDQATCYWCNDYGLFPHAWNAVDDRTHYCSNGKGHLQGLPHVWDDPATSNYCTVCRWSRGGEYEYSFAKCDDDCDCGILYRYPVGLPELAEVAEVRCFYWNWNTMHCDCPGGCTKEGCICKTLTDVLKITSPIIHSEQYKQAFIGSSYVVIDMDDPVYNVMTRGFYQAFMNMPYLKTVNCSAITNCESEAFYMAFSNCTALTHVDFHRLRTAGGSSFFSAFKDDTDLQSVDFIGLETAAGYSFSSAFENAFDATGYATANFGVRDAMANAFEFCFYDSNVKFASFSSLTNAGNYAFQSAFYGCDHIGSAGFTSLECAGDYCFWYAYDESDFNGGVNFPKLKKAGNYAFEYAFNNCMVTNADFQLLEKAGTSAFSNAFAHENNYALKTVDFGSITNAIGVFGTIDGEDSAFRGCTNVSKWVFSKLMAGEVELPESYADTDVDARYVGSNAVVDVSRLHNLSRIHFDEVENIVNYNEDWIPVNTNWTASIPHALYETWIAKPGWSSYTTNFLCGAKESTEYDYYMAETGSDDNDGLTWRRPKRTLRGVWNAANTRTDKTDFTCSVSQGHYIHAEKGTFQSMNASWANRIKKRVSFHAVDGADKTFIEATPGNLEREEDAYFDNMLVSLYDNELNARPSDADSVNFDAGSRGWVYVYRYQNFHNFTVRNFATTRGGTGGSYYKRNGPCFGGLRFYDCKIEDNFFWEAQLGFGAVSCCNFVNCSFRGNIFYNSSSSGLRSRNFIHDTMTNCSVVANESYRPASFKTTYCVFDFSRGVDHCYFNFDDWDDRDYLVGTYGGLPFDFCTYVLGSDGLGEHSESDTISKSRNCYICIGTNTLHSGGVDNVFGVSWTNTFLDANGYPTNGCPAIRVGMPDAGWKQHVGGVPLSATLKAVGDAEFRYEPNGKFDKIKSHPERFLNEK